MDDLDYSVHIAERDWDSFYQESEECDLRQAALAGLDESGLSDFDESECFLLGSRRSIDGTTDFTGPTDEHCRGVGGAKGPEDVSPGSKEDECQQSVNHGAPRDSEGATAEEEHVVKTDHPGMIELTMESAEQGNKGSTEQLTDERVLQVSNDVAVESALLTSKDSGLYSSPTEEDLLSGFKGSQERGNTGEEGADGDLSSLTGSSASSFDPDLGLQMGAVAGPSPDTPERDEPLKDGNEAPRKEKERWFVTVNVGQPRPRENAVAKKKKKKKKL
ncbi:uncharacterized protein LOC118779514 [Megalops cyprinoides]|uniref:uncharacterized protein LOC118779514 n=1 Tax=Megalops cyprinoides TaxID=118141 RepID=UPI00186544A6|nr:uncharacterized protein LOC118779514 [Megalops cyprinoides]